MLKLEGWVPVEFTLREHHIAMSHLSVSSNIELSKEEKTAIEVAITLFELELVEDGMAGSQDIAAVYFLKDDTFTLSIVDSRPIGLFQNSIFLPVHRWREGSFTGVDISVAILEELCHCFWHITDESLVKDKVTQIYNRWMSVTRETLYASFMNH